ncbi:hypothetical protein B4U37_07555 [Sutcliffiella horikoshii]|uniref:Uncharacterized protein n=1 Tax=Sutcliffiella horikoshii TaxID=79883 RepID=A0ABN4ZC77_9BACI|nr:hypothetical protein B4U37_07555 [Sutcliffiella horikoshii]
MTARNENAANTVSGDFEKLRATFEIYGRFRTTFGRKFEFTGDFSDLRAKIEKNGRFPLIVKCR